MTKRILSIAAIAAIMTSGAVAFDTNRAGDILTQTDATELGTYNWTGDNLMATSPLQASMDGKGDALMFPLFTQEGDWGTEMVVRNNTGYATVAKVVVLAADDSREVIDFNIYLTPHDVFRFKIEDGKLISTDGSVIQDANAGYSSYTFASPTNPLELDVKDLYGNTVENGYVLVLGMGQVNTLGTYDQRTDQVVDRYIDHMNNVRPEWINNSWVDGVYVNANALIAAPNLAEPAACAEGPYADGLCDVVDDTFSGQVRIYNGTDTTRDMLLNAVAAENYTDNTVMLWAPGEYATWHDRSLDDATNPARGCPEVAVGDVAYNCASVGQDALNFRVDSAYYTFANGSGNPSVANKMIITQPHKRTMVQLQESNESTIWHYTDYWNKQCRDYTQPIGVPVTGLRYGFDASLSIWDEAENDDPGSGDISSPAASDGHCTEIAVLEDLEDLATNDYSDKNGYVVVDFRTTDGLPAIITQQTASKVNGDGHINWVPSIVNMNLPN